MLLKLNKTVVNPAFQKLSLCCVQRPAIKISLLFRCYEHINRVKIQTNGIGMNFL